MFLLPLIELRNGECVHPFPEQSQGEALPLVDPKEVALHFQRLGAVSIHVVDLDAAEGRAPNDEALLSIVDASHVPVQFAGGVRSMKRIQELLDTGVVRVIVGSMAIQHEDWMREAARCFPKGLVVNLDDKEGHAWVKARSEDSGKPVEDLALRFDALGLDGLVLTQVDDVSPGPLYALIKRLQTPTMVQRRFRSSAELLAAKESGVRAAILGQEIYDRTLDFVELNKTFRSL